MTVEIKEEILECKECDVEGTWEGGSSKGSLWECEECGEIICLKCAMEAGKKYNFDDRHSAPTQKESIVCLDCAKKIVVREIKSQWRNIIENHNAKYNTDTVCLVYTTDPHKTRRSYVLRGVLGYSEKIKEEIIEIILQLVREEVIERVPDEVTVKMVQKGTIHTDGDFI